MKNPPADQDVRVHKASPLNAPPKKETMEAAATAKELFALQSALVRLEMEIRALTKKAFKEKLINPNALVAVATTLRAQGEQCYDIAASLVDPDEISTDEETEQCPPSSSSFSVEPAASGKPSVISIGLS